MKVVAIIQARMGSTRLPGKVLEDVAGETVLARCLNRVRRARLIDEVLVATTDQPVDEAVVGECKRVGAQVFRGDQNDVLDRYFRAAQYVKADVIVRITSDCPLIDPDITDKTIGAFLETYPDYASNSIVRTYPRGLDTEVMTRDALSHAWRVARQPCEREHVTPYIYEHPSDFKLLSVTGDFDYSGHRWTVDTPDDLALIRAIYSHLKGRPNFSWRDVLDLLERMPELIEINRSVVQKALH